ncbi:hypothetical protein [Pengzhenrongella sp.]|jgi:hypothetical protein|uniref:hypothetical protein n=1 Tax=Pengzhenrongella sp. TaxID=2888820 RepID=UPI002F95A675
MPISSRFPRWAGAAVAVATLAGTLLLPTAAATAGPAEHRAGPSAVDEQIGFILSKQLDSGAILSTGTRISPYFANIAALGLLAADTPAARAGTLRWMTWNLAHLNAAGLNVPANSVFDYIYDPVARTETPTGDFDSVDSYASTALNVAYAAHSSTDPALRSFVRRNIGVYEAIADLVITPAPTGVLVETGPDAGLTIAKPSYPIAFTMDNTEVYAGLVDLAKLETSLGRHPEAALYASRAAATKSAMGAELWNVANDNWDWAYANPSSTDVFYAQGTAQLWPIIFGVVTPNDPRARAGWAQFVASFPRWFDGALPDSYPWVAVARAAQLMGEPAQAAAFLEGVHTRYAPGFALPTTCGAAVCGQWYDAEAGWFLLATTASLESCRIPGAPVRARSDGRCA